MKEHKNTSEEITQSISFLTELLSNQISERIMDNLKDSLSSIHSSVVDTECLHTNAEVMNRYKISYSTLRKLRSNKDFPKIKIGTDFRYSFQKLDEWFSK